MRHLYHSLLFLGMTSGLASATTISDSPCSAIDLTIGSLDVGGSAFSFSQDSTGVCSFSGGDASTPLIDVAGSFQLNMVRFSQFTDPFVDYGYSITNTGSTPLPVSFSDIQPYVGGSYKLLTDSFSDSITDSGTSPDGVVTIGVPAGNVVVHQPIIDGLRYDGINTGCTVTGVPGFSSPGCVATNVLNTMIVNTGLSGTFGVNVNFILSPGDVYTINGRVDLSNSSSFGVTTPEPASGPVMLGGAFMLLAFSLVSRRFMTRKT